MRQVEDLQAGWEQEKNKEKAAAEKKTKKIKNVQAPDAEEAGLFPEEEEEEQRATTTATDLFGESDESDGEDFTPKTGSDNEKADAPAVQTTQQDLFGSSDESDSDEELVPSGSKRENENKDIEEEQPMKKRKVLDDDDDDSD